MAALTPPGTNGGRVAANLRYFRRGRSTYEIARALKDIGRPIAANGLTKIENGERRVTVDDLVALAVVLGVSPNQLLFPTMMSRNGEPSPLPLVGTAVADDADIWRWANGERPLRTLDPGSGEYSEEPSGQEIAAFVLGANPHHYITAAERYDDIVAALADAFRSAVKTGADPESVRKLLDRAITEAAHESS
jgi:transcriptional regulator with XRE-family HTH domain